MFRIERMRCCMFGAQRAQPMPQAAIFASLRVSLQQCALTNSTHGFLSASSIPAFVIETDHHQSVGARFIL